MDGNTDPNGDSPAYTPPTEGRTISAFERVGTAHRDELLVDLFEEIEPPITVDELADRLVAQQRHRSNEDDLKWWADAHEQLHSVILPSLDRTGQIDFDASTGIVTPVDERTDDSVAPADGDGQKSYVRLLGLLAISPMLIGLLSVGVWPISSVQTLSLAGGIIVLVATLALVRIAGES